ncbi:MAG: HD domain-containing protein [Lachnospiraceae bacterium]|nr:HD domain-containing protein [Lachnospiraceae bacterium]
MTDRNRIKKAFGEYTDKYDPSDVKISLKIDHTYRVAENAELIAKDLGLEEEGVFLAFAMGMLHDFGRFEQVKRYGTFIDRKSIDHAELGADLLFQDGHIWDFFDEEDLDMETSALIEKVIRLHNKLTLTEGLSEKEILFCNIIRDADKIDIFRVLAEVEYEDGKAGETKTSPDGARDSIMQCVREHRCVPRIGDRTEFEVWVSRYCMAFELVFPISRKLAKEQGCLAQILERQPQNVIEQEQLALIRTELAYFLQ